MKSIFIKPLCYTAIALFALGCTDLEVEELDSLVVETDGTFKGVDPGEALGTAYADIRTITQTQENLYALSVVTSDEQLVPTRGVDWGDNGTWRALHLQNWTPTHNFVLNTWGQLNGNVFRLNQLLDPISNPSAEQAAEAKFLRAFNMFWIVDLWGQVPFRDPSQGIEEFPDVLTAQQAVDLIINDLQEALPLLPSSGPNYDMTAKASKAAAHHLLAKVYLNKHVFLGGEEASEADMQQVIDNVDAISALGFDIEDDFFDIFNFQTRQENHPEVIWWVDAEPASKIWNSLHYNQFSPTQAGGWNGFSTTAEFYSLFEGPEDTNAPGQGQEERRGFVPEQGIGYGFLVGQQYGMDGEALTDRSGAPLVYTKDFPNGLTGNNELNGMRLIKYNPDNSSYDRYWVLMRYSDAHLMKAEAFARMGNMGEALTLVNELRALRDATPFSSLEMMDILDERGRELYIEGWRRQDQIRFGTFTTEHELKPATEDFRRLFPIPATAITTNPNLEQNPGY